MALLSAIDNGQSKPFRVHGGDQTEEESLLRFPVTLAVPSVGNVLEELRDVLHLLPHVDN